MSAIGMLPAIALVTGAALAIATTVSSGTVVWAMPVCLAAAFVCWRRDALWPAAFATALGFAVAGMALGADARDAALHGTLRGVLDREFGGFAMEAIEPPLDREPVPMRAVLVEDAASDGEFVSMRVDARALWLRSRWVAVSGGVRLAVSGTDALRHLPEWRAGRAIEAPVVFRRPARYLNDGVPDFERALALDGIALFGSVKSGLLVDVRQKGSRLQELAAAARASVRASVARWVAPHDAVSAAIVTAILIGDRSALPDETRTRLQAAGTYHVIAISGGNIAILAGVTIGVLSLAGISGRAASLLTIALLVGYAHVAVSGTSVWRATMMAAVYFAARALDHRTSPWHAAGVAAAGLAIAQPLDLRAPGFVLTFGATLALLEAARRAQRRAPLTTRVTPSRRMAAWLAAMVVASAATELALLPVSALTFSRVTIAGLALNLAAVPLMTMVQLAGMVVAACDALPVVPAAAGWIAHLAATALVETARVVDLLPWLARRVPPPAWWLVVTYYAALAGALAGRSVNARVMSMATVALAAMLIAAGIDPMAGPRRPDSGVLRLTVFDVGQGDAMLLQIPGRTAVRPASWRPRQRHDERRDTSSAPPAAVLIDAGGTPFGGGIDIGARVLAPALWARGVSALDALLITHGDPDHLGGAGAVLDDFRPLALWLGIPVPRHAPSHELALHADRLGVVTQWLRRDADVTVGAVRLRVLNPPRPDWERLRVRNDDSVVIEAVYGDVAILFTGDIGADVEREIAPRLTPARTRILKVAHHGSRSSSSAEILEAWRPQIAIISCGRANRFGHPAPEVLARLEAIGARIYRTDRDGEVTVETNGVGVGVRTFIERQP